MIPRWLRLPVALALLAAPAPAVAHAILVESSPALAATIPPGAFTVTLRFNSRIDHARSRLTLGQRGRQQVILDIFDHSSDGVLMARAQVPAGDYVLRWQVLAIDGHITRGELPFTVQP